MSVSTACEEGARVVLKIRVKKTDILANDSAELLVLL
jgi:hypothetical protein